MNTAIKVENVSKTFKLPHEKNTSIKSAFINLLRTHKKGYEIQHALKNVSFEIKKGQFFGIVGRNGSGKSTLLKLLAGIYIPTSGGIDVEGKLTPFIELGVGFNPELTGRENVYLNGALLGFNRKDMHAMYKDIVDFADLEKFMDQKLKNYSSGMQVRLAFSIAIRAQSDILLIDEVLAVGDASFQQKCYEYFRSIKNSGRTVIFVSHDMDAIKRFCDACLFLDAGEVKKTGNPNIIADAYIRANNQLMVEEAKKMKMVSSARKFSIDTFDSRGQKANKFEYLDEMIVRLSWTDQLKGVKNAGIAIFKENEYVFGVNTINRKTDSTQKKFSLSLKLNLSSGKYRVVAGLFGSSDREVVDFESYGPEFIVQPSTHKEEWGGLTHLEHQWE